MIRRAVGKLTLKKVCANCVMVAGAVTALTGATKSVIELFPPGCGLRMQMAVRQVDQDPLVAESQPVPPPVVVPVPPPPPLPHDGFSPAAVARLEESGSRAPEPLHGRFGPGEEEIRLMMAQPVVQERRKVVWVWPVLLVLGIAAVLAGRRMKRTARKAVEEVARV